MTLELVSKLYWSGSVAEANSVLAAAPSGVVPTGGVDVVKKEFAAAIDGTLTLRTGRGDIYDEQNVIDTWWRYWRHFNQLTEWQHNEPFVMGRSFGDCLRLSRKRAQSR
ncbi:MULTISPECIES: hypothetical protein [Phyllobacteriaceae]|uniref:hypothetical protein n=1 Tax=Phyllobacteriaceae TaxID=69277 RepID=UPI0004674AFC|nr:MULTISPECIES: hypothetical protein [Mesorhizobium]MBN9236193.1 hypothetical protein [Mesorhizobium sp.]MDQ0327909.1 hypothetical protein [Mesorhizobium sp. YL-MeA3-2017]